MPEIMPSRLRSTTADILPLMADPIELKVIYSDDGPRTRTYIGRQFADPDNCRGCPGRACAHGGPGGFCMIEAPGIVPEELAGRYVLPAPAAGIGERSAGTRV